MGAVAATHNGKTRFVRFGRKGMSDIIGLIPPAGRLVAVEIKAHGGKTTLEQEAFLHAVRKAGGIAVVARSCDDVVQALGL